jgi:hypothetical protein
MAARHRQALWHEGEPLYMGGALTVERHCHGRARWPLARDGHGYTVTDPKVAAAFATHAEQFGQGVVHLATPADLTGLKVELNAGYLPYEAEAYVSTTPADFAARASTTISASTARSVLGEMGIQVPGLIISPADLTTFLRNSPLMSSEQIAQFLARIGG